MPLRAALNERLKNDLSALRKGVESMEAGILRTGESDGGWIIDRTKETVEQYRGMIAELERSLASIEAEGK